MKYDHELRGPIYLWVHVFLSDLVLSLGKGWCWEEKNRLFIIIIKISGCFPLAFSCLEYFWFGAAWWAVPFGLLCYADCHRAIALLVNTLWATIRCPAEHNSAHGRKCSSVSSIFLSCSFGLWNEGPSKLVRWDTYCTGMCLVRTTQAWEKCLPFHVWQSLLKAPTERHVGFAFCECNQPTDVAYDQLR